MTWDMENLVSHFPPKHLGDKDVGNCEEAGYVEDTWGAATFLLFTCSCSHKAEIPLEFRHPLTCGVGDTVLCTRVSIKAQEACLHHLKISSGHTALQGGYFLVEVKIFNFPPELT